MVRPGSTRARAFFASRGLFAAPTLHRRRVLAVLVFVVLALSAGTACQSQPSTELLQVSALVPDQVQLGGSVQIVGDGFALSKPSTVRLTGTVYRAGRPPRDVDVALAASTESQHELSVALGRDLQLEFCGASEEASHGTFRGDVQVAIAAKSKGAPPVTGTLHGAVLEVYPAMKTRAAEARTAELGRKALRFFGLGVAPAADGGLVVVELAPGGRASIAGLLTGDRVVGAGGVSVLQASDLVPEPSRRVPVAVLRDGGEVTVVLDADGFFQRPPVDTDPIALLIFALSLCLVCFASPLLRGLSWLEWQLVDAARIRAARRQVQRRRPPPPRPRRAGFGALVAVAIWLAVGAALISPGLRSNPVDPALGLYGVAFASATLLGAWSLLQGGRVGERWSIARGTRAAFCHFIVGAPAWAALLCVAFERGMDFDALRLTQGALPWHWNAFRNPGFAALFVVLVLAMVPTVGQFRRPLSYTSLQPRRFAAANGGALGWIFLCSVCGISAMAFLGGGKLSAETTLKGAAFGVGSWLPAVLLLTKYSLLVAAVLFLRTLCSSPTASEWAQLALRVLLPVAGVAAVVAHLFPLVSQLDPLLTWLERGFGPACVGAAGLTLAVVSARLVRALAQPAPPTALSPWL